MPEEEPVMSTLLMFIGPRAGERANAEAYAKK
jgi:hypothetical protein